MEGDDNNNLPKAFQSFTIDNHKLKTTLFANKLTIGLQNLENQKTYSYEFHQDDSQKFPFFVDSIPSFYQLLFEALNNLKEGYHVRIFPEEKIKLDYKVTTKTRIIDLTFDCPIKEIYPQVSIDLKSQGIPLPELDDLRDRINPQIAMNPVAQENLPLKFDTSQKSLVQDEIISFAELGLEIQNLLRNNGGQRNASDLLNSFIRETKKTSKELESIKEKIEEKEEAKYQRRPNEEILKKLKEEEEERFNSFKANIENKLEDKIQQAIQVLRLDMKNHEHKINTLQTKMWENLTMVSPSDKHQEPFEIRLEKIETEFKRRLKNLEERLDESQKSLCINSKYSLSETDFDIFQKEFDELKESQQVEKTLRISLLDQLTERMTKENDFKNRFKHLNDSIGGLAIESSKSKNQLTAEILELRETLEKIRTKFENKIDKLDTLQEIEAQMRKLIIPSNKELKSFDKKKLQFDPELFDLTLQLKDDNEISMNAFAAHSTKRIYSHIPLPDSGKFMFSINFKDLKLGENGAVFFGVAPFRTQEELKGLPGSFLINVRDGQAYLGAHLVRFKTEELTPKDVLQLYLNLQDEWIHFSINNRFIFHEKIDTEKWEQGKTYGGIITTACERLNACFV